MKEFCALRAKANIYLMDDSEKKKAKGIKRYAVKRRHMFKNYNDSLFNNKTILKSELRFKSDHHNVYPEEVNKIALNSTTSDTTLASDNPLRFRKNIFSIYNKNHDNY